jgi:hypothetical protein
MRLPLPRRWLLRGCLFLMARLEAHGAEESEMYYRLARVAMQCNPWRKTWH